MTIDGDIFKVCCLAAGYSVEEADRLTSLISESVQNLTALLQDVRSRQLKGNDLKLICAKSELLISECYFVDNSHVCVYDFYFKHNHKNTISAQIYNTTA